MQNKLMEKETSILKERPRVKGTEGKRGNLSYSTRNWQR